MSSGAPGQSCGFHIRIGPDPLRGPHLCDLCLSLHGRAWPEFAGGGALPRRRPRLDQNSHSLFRHLPRTDRQNVYSRKRAPAGARLSAV